MDPDPNLDPALRVDWLERDELARAGRGRVGLTFLPGKHGPSFRYPGRVYRRDLDRDLDTLRAEGIRTLVLLVDDAELRRWGDPDIVKRGATHGIRIVRHPLTDGTAPASPAEMDVILGRLAEGREIGDVAVACMGGVGRTGTVAACALIAAGADASTAIRRVREVRHPEAVETDEQVAFVHAYEGHVAARPGTDTVAR